MASDKPSNEEAARSLPAPRIVEGEIILPAQALNTTRSSEALETLQAIAEKIGQRQRSIVEHVIASGKDLSEAKDLLGHGAFLRWIDEHFGMSARTAQNYMAVAKTFRRMPERVSYLPVTLLYRLCERRTPDVTRKKVLILLGTGERPTAQQIGNIITVAREKVPPRETTARYQLRTKHDRAWAARTKRIKLAKEDREWRLSEIFVRNIGPSCQDRLPEIIDFLETAGLEAIRRAGSRLRNHLPRKGYIGPMKDYRR